MVYQGTSNLTDVGAGTSWHGRSTHRAASDGGQPPHGTIPRKAAGCMDQLAPRAVATMVSVRWDIAMD